MKLISRKIQPVGLEEIDRLFNSPFERWTRELASMETPWSPAVDVYESNDALVVKAEMPGLNKDDIQVTIEGDLLTLKGEKREERDVKEKNFLRSERVYGSFQRTLSLPTIVEAGAVKAVYQNGILELTLPKKEEAKPKAVPVEVK